MRVSMSFLVYWIEVNGPLEPLELMNGVDLELVEDLDVEEGDTR